MVVGFARLVAGISVDAPAGVTVDARAGVSVDTLVKYAVLSYGGVPSSRLVHGGPRVSYDVNSV